MNNKYPNECESCGKLYANGLNQMLVNILVSGSLAFVVFRISVLLNTYSILIVIVPFVSYLSIKLFQIPVKYKVSNSGFNRWCTSCDREDTPKTNWWQRECDYCQNKSANK